PAELVDDLLGPGVLPDDRVVDRFAGVLVPDDRGLALVGDADRGDVALAQRCPGQGQTDHLAGVPPDLQRIVLHPAGLRQDLLVLDLPGLHDLTGVVEDDGAGAGRSLVDGEYVVRHLFPFLGIRCGRIFSTLPCDASVADSPPHAGVVARCPDCHSCPARTSAQPSCTNVHRCRGKDERVREDDAYRAAAMYYLQDQTMEVTAGTLGVSRYTVSRLIKAVRDEG